VGAGGNDDREVTERVRTVGELLDGLGDLVEELDNRSICAWAALWPAPRRLPFLDAGERDWFAGHFSARRTRPGPAAYRDAALQQFSPRGSTAHIAAQIERACPEWSGAILPVYVGTESSGGTRN
jgi:hypothetical protein